MSFVVNDISIPSIGFGPGICGYGRKLLNDKKWYLLSKIYNGIMINSIDRIKYVNSVSNAINNGF